MGGMPCGRARLHLPHTCTGSNWGHLVHARHAPSCCAHLPATHTAPGTYFLLHSHASCFTSAFYKEEGGLGHFLAGAAWDGSGRAAKLARRLARIPLLPTHLGHFATTTAPLLAAHHPTPRLLDLSPQHYTHPFHSCPQSITFPSEELTLPATGTAGHRNTAPICCI